MKERKQENEVLRALCAYLGAGEIIGFVVGTFLLPTSFGICGPTFQFEMAVPVLWASSACMGANLLCLRGLRRRGEGNLDVLTAMAWLGAPGLLLTLVSVLFWGLIHLH
jgi:hypothetical protein